MKPQWTELGKRVHQFILRASGPDREIAWLLHRVLGDKTLAYRLGLLEKPLRGRSADHAIEHADIAAEYLIERHLLGNTRSASAEAKRIVCARHPGLETRSLERYLKRSRLDAYILYRQAVNDGCCGLSGEPDIPADVLAEIDQLVRSIRDRK